MDFDVFFSALSHPLRLRALLLLHQEGELCVCELNHVLQVSQPMLSRHLAHLRKWGLVNDRQQGLWVYYRLSDNLPDWAAQVLANTADGVSGKSPYADDLEALAAIPDRPESACCA
ncbi:MAG: ArsR family transcriptional regulator [Gammaproteobacteria bacterium]|nr:MAG: ArsR family transcriptional regulator [Gammaproteobacteria bacterium]